jgi:hypothetical protein
LPQCGNALRSFARCAKLQRCKSVKEANALCYLWNRLICYRDLPFCMFFRILEYCNGLTGGNYGNKASARNGPTSLG